MANHNYDFTPEVESALNELRIDTIRENKEMSEQQVVIECIFEKFSRKHGSKNAPAVEEKEIEHECIENETSISKYWTVNDAISFIKEQTGVKFDNCIIYNAARNDEINYVYIGNRYYFTPQDVKKWLDNHKNNNTRKINKVTLPPPIQKKEKKKRVYTEEQLEKMRERATHARMFIGKQKQEITQCVTN